MANWFDGTMVKMLSGADFKDKEPWKMKSDRCAVVLFFADWCGHCQDLKPEYIKFADIAQFIRVHAVDSDASSTLIKGISDNPKSPVKIKGFPTVWLYKNGDPYKEYTGKNTWQGLLKAAKDLCDTNCHCERT